MVKGSQQQRQSLIAAVSPCYFIDYTKSTILRCGADIDLFAIIQEYQCTEKVPHTARYVFNCNRMISTIAVIYGCIKGFIMILLEHTIDQVNFFTIDKKTHL